MDLATLQHSVLLHALGSAILSSFWQGFILWIIYETINIFYKAATSAFKNKISTVLMFIAFAWFISSFIAGISFDEKILSAISSSSNADIIPRVVAVNGFTFLYLFSLATVVLPYLSVSYIFLLIFLMGKLFTAYRHVYFIANKRLIVPPSQLQEFASKVAARMMIVKKISVWISDYIDVPATIGFIKPVILIPVASINNLSSHQLEAIILHELSHIKRNDYLVNLFISVIETILFFNPFIFLLSKALKRERENCCDDFVIQYRYDPHSYASALLRLEQSRRSNLQLSLGAVSGKKQLLTRIKRITNNQAASKQFNYGQKLCALLLITGIVCSVAWLSPQKDKARNKQETKILEKPVNIPLATPNKKTELINIGNGPTTFDLRKVKKEKEKRAIVSFDETGSNLTIPEDNKMENPERNDFENYSEKLVDGQASKRQKLFSLNKIKIAPFKAFLNFQFPNPDLNNNVTELNKGLLKAYKEINKMNWNKIENNINESLSNIDINQLLKTEGDELNNEKVKHFEALKRLKSQRNNTELLSTGAKPEFLLRDSLQTAAIALADEAYSKAQTWSNVDNRNINYGRGNYNYVYASKPRSTTKSTVPETKRTAKSFTVTGLNNKNVKVIIEHLTQAFKNEKSSFNFTSSSMEKKITPETNHKIIRIEINETP